jgi:hypothetical protein
VVKYLFLDTSSVSITACIGPSYPDLDITPLFSWSGPLLESLDKISIYFQTVLDTIFCCKVSSRAMS